MSRSSRAASALFVASAEFDIVVSSKVAGRAGISREYEERSVRAKNGLDQVESARRFGAGDSVVYAAGLTDKGAERCHVVKPTKRVVKSVRN